MRGDAQVGEKPWKKTQRLFWMCEVEVTAKEKHGSGMWSEQQGAERISSGQCTERKQMQQDGSHWGPRKRNKPWVHRGEEIWFLESCGHCFPSLSLVSGLHDVTKDGFILRSHVQRSVTHDLLNCFQFWTKCLLLIFSLCLLISHPSTSKLHPAAERYLPLPRQWADWHCCLSPAACTHKSWKINLSFCPSFKHDWKQPVGSEL